LALAVARARRSRAPSAGWQPSWSGLAVLAAACTLRLTSAYFYLDWLDGASLLVVLVGLSLLIGGWPLCRGVGPAVLVLVFLLPVPTPLEDVLSARLQRLATVAGTYLLQTSGLPAVAEGNVIAIEDTKIGVLEACNGLGTLSAFFAISMTLALVLRRPVLLRLVLFCSAMPIGVFMNVLRVTATGLAYGVGISQTTQAFFHDLAGWIMMPLALAALAAELWLLDHLWIAPTAGPQARTTLASA
jgi:exosortase